jgi:hypothetical protein
MVVSNSMASSSMPSCSRMLFTVCTSLSTCALRGMSVKELLNCSCLCYAVGCNDMLCSGGGVRYLDSRWISCSIIVVVL